VRVFVAGHAGLVGKALLRSAPKHYELITVSKTQVDLRNPNEVSAFLTKFQPDAIIMSAARVGGIGANSASQFNFLLDNLKIQNAVLENAAHHEVPNLIFLGSSCIYPKFANQPISEKALLTGSLEATNEGYAIAKIAGVRMTRAIHDELGLNYFSLMPTNLYGPGDNFDYFTSHVPAALMRRFHEARLRGENQVTVWGTGRPKREFMHVDDLAQACWFFLNRNVGGEIINIGTTEEISIKDFSNLMADITGYEGQIIFDSSKPDGSPRKLLDTQKAASLGWQSKIKLRAGIAETYDWFVNASMKGEIRGY
jgi:GDP-L-fucose synthase